MSSRRRSARIASLEKDVSSPKKTTLPLKKQPLREEVLSRTKPIIPTLLKRPVTKETTSDLPLVQEPKLSEVTEVLEAKSRDSTSPKETEINDERESLTTSDEKEASIEPERETASAANNESSMDVDPKQKNVIKDRKFQKPCDENLPPVKGRCKSGRFWKSERDRFRSVIKTKGLKSNLKQRMKHKEDMRRVKAYEQSLKDRVKKEKEELRARQEQNKKNREENLRKSEVVQQVII